MRSGSFTDPEYGAVGLTESQAARDHELAIGIARYDDLLRPAADGHADGFCKLIADRSSHRVLGAHVLGEFSAETVQVVATAMSAGMTVEQLANMQFTRPSPKPSAWPPRRPVAPSVPVHTRLRFTIRSRHHSDSPP